MSEVRTRFAPSPTGFLHVGGIRTALFAWLVAKQLDGKFILRLEDTDKAREVDGSAEHIMQSLRWLGIQWDEGLGIGGDYGPYLQSERLDVYKEWANKLVESGRAYADPYTKDEVEKFRDEAKKAKKPFLYRDYRPEINSKWDGAHTLRFKSDPKTYQWEDAVMGKLSSGPEAIDDFVLIKSDGYPTYNFCHIIDDYLMKCTHVIRSQEFVSSVPKFLNLYEALDLPPPILATMPYVLGPDGKKKLSKRDGAKDILDYQREGYLPEALISFMATLGWNDGTEQEVFTVQELIKKFSLKRVQKSGAKFDETRLRWVNGYLIRSLDLEELYQKSQNFWTKSAEKYDDDYRKRVLALVQDRLKFFAELPELTEFFFTELPVNIELIAAHKQLKKVSREEQRSILKKTIESLEKSDFSEEDITNRLNDLLETTHQKPSILFSLVRIVTTWSSSSPELIGSLEALGKEQTILRIRKSLTLI